MVLLISMAIFAPLVSPENYLSYNYLALSAPPRWAFPWSHDWKYLLGTDAQGHALLDVGNVRRARLWPSV